MPPYRNLVPFSSPVMAADTQPSTVETSQPSEPWSIDDLESALAHLERLQHQIDHLRSALPDLLKPLTPSSRKRTHSDADGTKLGASVLFEVRNTAVRKSEEVKALGEAWRGEETRRVLERAWESERADGDLGRCVEVARWGWIEKMEERKAGKVGESQG